MRHVKSRRGKREGEHSSLQHIAGIAEEVRYAFLVAVALNLNGQVSSWHHALKCNGGRC